MSALDSLISWAIAGGLHAHDRITVSFDTLTGERSVKATGQISAGEVLLRVPRSLMFMGKLSMDQHAAAPRPKRESDCLAFDLLNELRHQSLGTPSFWAPYFAVLPTRLGTPLFFNSTEREWLRGSELLGLLARRERELKASHVLLQEHLHQIAAATESTAVGGRGASAAVDGRINAPFTLRDVGQVYSLLWSRCFMVKVPDSLCTVMPDDHAACRRPALVPIGDFFNHAAEAEANVYSYTDVGAADGALVFFAA